MIVQISLVRNELPLIKQLLPIWSKYADAFVFLLDTSDDGTEDYLTALKNEYNILEIIVQKRKSDELWVASEVRQCLFDAARKYSNKIICLDADEYLDGSITKKQLETLLDENKDTVLYLKWVQYTSSNSIRVDGPWKNNYTDRIGSYINDYKIKKHAMHASHLPITNNQISIPEDVLFVAHLQWLDKYQVGIKQYCYKLEDYANYKKFNAEIIDISGYDASVNNFNWEEEYYNYPLKIKDDIFDYLSNSKNFRIKLILDLIKEHSIPNLGDWGLNIHNNIPMYFYIQADYKNYDLLLNLIGSLHKHNFYDIEKIYILDLGFLKNQISELNNIKKINIIKSENDLPKDLRILKLDTKYQIKKPLNLLFNDIIINLKETIDFNLEKNRDEFQLLSELNYVDLKINVASIKRNFIVSCITAIGDLDRYEKFIDSYFNNIFTQDNFNRTEFVIVYNEWSNKFNMYKHFENIVFVQDTEKTGVYNAWNIGIQNCTSEFVTNWNIDDLRYPINNKIKYDVLNKNKNIDLVYNYYTSATVKEIESEVNLNDKPFIKYPDEFHKHCKLACMAGPDPMWRKSIHIFIGYFNKEYTIVGDWEMWIRMSTKGLKTKLIPHVLCVYVDHEDTVSNSNPKKLDDQKIKLSNQYKEIQIPDVIDMLVKI
jgi:hypothetical protein